MFLHFFAALAASFAAFAVKDLTFLQIATKTFNRKGRKGFREVPQRRPEVTFVTFLSGSAGLTLLSSSLYTRLVAFTARFPWNASRG
jgi:hypothetical protein